MQKNEKNFSFNLIEWQKKHGRHHLPWQVNDPYKIWVSEIMLQQTQVESVKNYYLKFLNLFPNIQKLSQANTDDVLAAWAGLGYYARAKNLKKTADIIVNDLNNVFPNNQKELQKLPGIGKSTAAAIAVFGFNQKAAILDGNVKRILARYFYIEDYINKKETENKMWHIAENLLPQNEIKTYTQGLMDLGSLICTPKKPKCVECPFNKNCLAFQKKSVEELPKKEKIKRKILEIKWFFLFYENEIYFEKKPLKGIWGGLFCPIEENEKIENIKNIILKEYTLQNFTHHLTHRVLNIFPKIIVLKNKPKNLNGEWIDLNNILNKEIPAPLFKILKNLNNFPRST